MQAATLDSLRRQLSDRQTRLRTAISRGAGEENLVQLLEQVDSALGRIETQNYAHCLVCGGEVDEKDLVQNPLLEYCLCDLTPDQQRALEYDLQLARRIQAGLLPDPHLVSAGWEAHYRYEPLGMVSGDYCDLWINADDPETVFFAIGDVSGKGVAAALLMAHLQAAFRSLLESGVRLTQLVERVNRQLLRTSISSQYATLVVGRLSANGEVEMVNAGHCAPIVARAHGVETIRTTGFPVGLLADRPYEVNQFNLSKGETLVFYTDGLTEASKEPAGEFGPERVEDLLKRRSHGSPPRELVQAIRHDLAEFLGDAPLLDDLTILVMQRSSLG